ncbi:DegT/DnrJ/EryC1/StrS family aminotransferase, partial [Patescibacteria group bacterium]|nr:DegT/DnrJ/EryC1/StrS family aminotransferase [Patescibacteria group bacterium]
GIELPPKSDERHFDIYQNYVLRVSRRDELAMYLKERGAETLIKDPIALHHHPALGLSNFRLPYTEQLAKEVISLPIYPELTNKEVKYVIDCIRKFYV